MKAALAVNRVTADIDANLTMILDMVNEAADDHSDLVVFAEAALTGLINNDDPSHDLPLGQPIPGPVTDVLLGLAHEQHIWLAIGILEREGQTLYDSAVLLTPDGEIALKYRRIQPRWHGRSADPSVYRQGTELPKAETPLGSFAFLICGDLWDDELVQRARDLRPDWLLYPFARSGLDEERWEKKEMPDYAQRAKLTGTTTLMTSYLADPPPKDNEFGGSLGGAMVVSSDGTVVDSLPPSKTGILLVELQKS